MTAVVERTPVTEFGQLLRFYRERAGRSRNALCHDVGVDPSYGTRCENSDRAAPRVHIVDAFARSLRLTPVEWDALRLAAGHAPLSLERLGYWPPWLTTMLEAMAKERAGD